MIKTAESVTIAHPDKVCDQISDAVLDACLAQDPHTRVAIEVLGGHGIITVTGELTTKAKVNVRKIAEGVYKECGYKENIGITVKGNEVTFKTTYNDRSDFPFFADYDNTEYLVFDENGTWCSMKTVSSMKNS